MDEVLRLAENLGDHIATHERYRAVRAAEQAVEADQEITEALQAFETQREKISRLEAERKPVEVADKHEMQRLAGIVHGSPKLQTLAKAQADYMELMNRINQTIRGRLGADDTK